MGIMMTVMMVWKVVLANLVELERWLRPRSLRLADASFMMVATASWVTDADSTIWEKLVMDTLLHLATRRLLLMWLQLQLK